MTARFKLEGQGQLIRSLDLLAQRTRRRILKAAVKAAARPILTDAKRRARKLGRGSESTFQRDIRREAQEHRLYETIKAVTRTYRGSGTCVDILGPVYGAQYGYKGNIGHLIEEGHAKVLWGRRTGDRVRACPFMKPAFDANVGRAKQRMVDKVRIGILREVARVRAR